MNNAAMNLAVDAAIMFTLCSIPVVLGLGIGMLHNWISPRKGKIKA